MKVKQFRYSADNLGYLVYGNKECIAIDGGAVDDILSFIESKNLKLTFAVNTHSHPDHTMGTQTLVDKLNGKYVDLKTLVKNKTITVENQEINIYHTPGHTSDSICFHFDNILISGDTLFNGKLGRCFSGDLKGFFKSAKLLLSLPKETIIYAGHDYLEEYMAFAKGLEPDNIHIDKFLEHYNPNHVFSTLAEELKINPHLRFNDSKIIALLEKKGLPVETEYLRYSRAIPLF